MDQLPKFKPGNYHTERKLSVSLNGLPHGGGTGGQLRVEEGRVSPPEPLFRCLTFPRVPKGPFSSLTMASGVSFSFPTLHPSPVFHFPYDHPDVPGPKYICRYFLVFSSNSGPHSTCPTYSSYRGRRSSSFRTPVVP